MDTPLRNYVGCLLAHSLNYVGLGLAVPHWKAGIGPCHGDRAEPRGAGLSGEPVAVGPIELVATRPVWFLP